VYGDSHVVITGGLGFLGSNLAIRLVREGARVTIVDSSIEGCGANPHNIEPVRDAVTVIHHDIADAHLFRNVIGSASVIFNLAGEVSHIHSMQFPERDLLINTVSQLRFLEECRRTIPGVRIVYAGTRQIYGVPQYLPIDEQHPVNPVDFNGVHKYAATMYHHMLSRSGDLDAVVLRFTNIYGPRMALDIPCQGFLSTFIRKMVFAEDIEVFGDGEQLRDPVFVDDAVEALVRAGEAPYLSARTYNVGGPEPLSLHRIAEIALEVGGGASVRFRSFPPERKSIDIGSYYTDCRRIRTDLEFSPATSFRDGMRATLHFYREHLRHYLDPLGCEPICKLAEHKAQAATPAP
jgi:UDP-glucose 4-epimerase